MKKVALITGSSRGIGRACADALAHRGYAVCINYIERQDKAEELCQKLLAEGCEAMTHCADVADRRAVHEMVEAVKNRFGEVTLLVNNAGIARQSLFQDISEEYWRRIFDVNLNGAFNTVQEVLPSMLREHSGCIVNISSIWGLRGASCEVAYACTKAAIVGLTRGTNASHIIRATLDSICYQVNDVLRAMAADSGIAMKSLRVDGGASANNYLMQTMADISDLEVKRPRCVETTALGAAYLAGLAVGYWQSAEDITRNWSVDRVFCPAISEEERTKRIKGWNKAVRCAYHWARDEEE